MKTKRFLAFAAAALMIITCFAACRPKDENAFTIETNGKTVNVRTALYMCYLMEADYYFKDGATAAADKAGTTYEDYKTLKYEGKDYDTWTKERARKLVEEYAYYTTEYERLGLDEEYSYVSEAAEKDAETLWENFDKEDYEANGVSLNTYKDYYSCTTFLGAKYQSYIQSYGSSDYSCYNNYKKTLVYNLYITEPEEDHDHEGEETTAASASDSAETTVETTTAKKTDPEIEKLKGSLIPEDKEINSTLKENFVPVQMIDLSLLDDNGEAIDEDTKNSWMKILKGYKKELEAGKSFADIYEKADEEFSLSADSSSESGESTEASYDNVLVSKKVKDIINDTTDSEADENFTEAYKMKVGAVKIIENDDCLSLLVRKSVLKDKDANDTSFKEQYEDYAIDVIVKPIFQSDYVEKAIKAMKITVNDSAINYYSPDKIEYPTTTTESTETSAY